MRERVRDAGDAGLLLRLGSTIDEAVNARALGVAAAFRQRACAGVRDVLATYYSVAVHFDPLVADRDVLKSALEEDADRAVAAAGGRLIEVPVEYGGERGPDLEAVAAFAGCLPRDVIARHTAPEYRVFMLGFLPGFPYLGTVDSTIAAPRRSTPRVRVPEGSVGIAGIQTGIYPCASPGGWQIIGQTTRRMFDISRAQPALCAPGDRVRFVAAENLERPAARETIAAPALPATMTVLSPGLFTTIQDGGRWGHHASGVPVAGAMDLPALRAANALVGNAEETAALEITVLGPELRVEQTSAVAVAGGDLGATVDGAAVPPGTTAICRAGSRLRFTGRRSGGRAYLAAEGGFAVPVVLGSRSTHVRSGMGGLDGRALRAGDRLRIDAPGHQTPTDGRRPVAESSPRAFDAAGRTPVTLRVVYGPQHDWFPAEAFARLHSCRFTVQPDSDRMGYRLSSDGRIPRLSDEEMISDPTFAGALQVTPSGQPILLMADRPTTGGYPQIAVVISADLPRAGQLIPGDEVRFAFCSLSDALAALRAHKGERP